MKERKFKILAGLLSILLLFSLIIKLVNVPGGMILSGLVLGSFVLIAILLGSLIVAALLRLVFKKFSILTLYSVTTSIGFLLLHYNLYSPTLRIIVPPGFTGEVNLILSNVDDNILEVDSNGIGYVNQWTFDKIYTKPIVFESSGKNITERCVGFNPSTFWSKGKTCCLQGNQINTLSFEVVPIGKIGQKQYYSKDLTKLVDTSLVLATLHDRYTKIQTQPYEVELNKK
ncbi:hypothetical protein [Adhaeribacter pallidiroseus]|uniref:Uncharacterized protein n=1 Tax=Adhaeribacter pallidiroseus TaxID=2072847 RepID=A0A369QA96_9BACT|nr:hypothetical protein [Adhaeribacter pallidiroseus]RDC61614.1 hypothetical protein AHMF7616_00194 [Adhaeribacter pallidiroseus]